MPSVELNENVSDAVLTLKVVLNFIGEAMREYGEGTGGDGERYYAIYHPGWLNFDEFRVTPPHLEVVRRDEGSAGTVATIEAVRRESAIWYRPSILKPPLYALRLELGLVETIDEAFRVIATTDKMFRGES